jgi:hypothetical protein
MDPTDRKQLDIDCEVLLAMIDRWKGISERLEADNGPQNGINHAIDGLSDAQFYGYRVIEATRGFYPDTAA